MVIFFFVLSITGIFTVRQYASAVYAKRLKPTYGLTAL